jgi:Ca-activated chloride channel family protein
VAGASRTAATLQQAPATGGRDSAPLTFTLVSDDASRFGEPFSPTDRLRVTRDRERLTVRPAESPSGGFDIFLPLAVPGVGVSLATHRVNGEDGYFMLTLSPGMVKASPEPRDLAVIVDVSGSMSGEKIEQARDALVQLLGTLNARDRFRLIAFGNQVRAHTPEWSDATRTSVDEARVWVDRLTASGGTNIAGALDEAFRTPAGAGRLHLVIVITDGQPTVGETDPERIAARVEAGRGQARIFTFGVGHDLNTYLLDRIAVAGRGTVDYVEPGTTVEEAVGALANRIRLPVLVDLAFGGTPVQLSDVQPARLPDLYAGQELVVFGRYAPAGPAKTTAGELAIEGTRSGRSERFAARVEFPGHASSGDYIPGLWAARKVGELTRNIRLEGATPARIAEVRDLALRYGLLTEYTSYLVQEPSIAVTGSARLGGGAGGRGGAASPVRPAPPAASPVGEAAVTSARMQGRLLEARTQADVADVQVVAEAPLVDVQNAGILADGMAVNGRRADARIVAGRRFRLDSGVWVDGGHTAQAQVIALEPFSQAYFAVLARLPELTPYWSGFEAVTVAGSQVSIRVAPGGRSTLAAGELETLVRNFRAR